MKMAESSPKGLKTLWEKDKLLVTGNFSFSHSAEKKKKTFFKRSVLPTHKTAQERPMGSEFKLVHWNRK